MRPLTEISPARGRSRPAMERRVVVLPQPLGPSSVKRCPSATVKLTSWAALTIWPKSLGYSVKRPSIFSTFFTRGGPHPPLGSLRLRGPYAPRRSATSPARGGPTPRSGRSACGAPAPRAAPRPLLRLFPDAVLLAEPLSDE